MALSGFLIGHVVKTMRLSAAISTAAWLACGSIASALAEPPAAPAPVPADLAAGKQAYDANCARCHGPQGAGDGPDAQRSYPKPRNLAEGIYKFRTTASGTPPTDEDLFHTISAGLPGSRMPEFQRLPEEARKAIIQYIKSLSPIFQQQPEPVDMGKDPGFQGAKIARGQQVYKDLGCAACHGALGRGDGPSAPTLVDNWGEPIRPADLTQGWNYRGGSSPQQVMARFMAGIDGTPMPSYADAVPREDAWHLAYYVHALQIQPNWSRSVKAVPAQVLPQSAADPSWKLAPVTDLRLASTLYQGGKLLPATVAAIGIQAMYNENGIMFRLSWHDPSGPATAEAAAGEAPAQPPLPDAAALLLGADPRMKFAVGSLRGWPAGPDAPALDVLYWNSSNRGAIRESVSRDAARVAAGQEQGRQLEAQADYAEGEWSLVVLRPLAGHAEGAVALAPGSRALLGAMVWDGANQEQGRRRANSIWVELILQQESKEGR